MTLAQFRVMQPLDYRSAVEMWEDAVLYIIHDDGSESLANGEEDSEPQSRYLYAVERDEPHCLVHGDELCPDYAGLSVIDDGFGFCTLCEARIVTWRDIRDWGGVNAV